MWAIIGTPFFFLFGQFHIFFLLAKKKKKKGEKKDMLLGLGFSGCKFSLSAIGESV